MKIIALDLAKQTGWAVVTHTGTILSGHVKFDEMEFCGLSLAYWRWLNDSLDLYAPDLVVYEAPVVKHAHAAIILIGLSWMTLLACALRGISCHPVTNTQAKKHFAGRTYGKKEKPYPGIEEARRRGWSPRSTDEADALAILVYAIDRYTDSACVTGGRATSTRRSPGARGRTRRSRRQTTE